MICIYINGYFNSYVEDTLWTGNPGNYTNPNAPEALSQVRKLVDNGQYVEATAAAVKLSGAPSDVCNLITFDAFCFFIIYVAQLIWNKTYFDLIELLELSGLFYFVKQAMQFIMNLCVASQ